MLNVIGVTEQQFIDMYGWNRKVPNAVHFMGRIDHLEVIRMVKASDWAIILRENNRVVKAGFPTKLVEAISCGTGVIVNTFSNITDYISNENGIIIRDYSQLEHALAEESAIRKQVDNTIFDYRNYLKELTALL